ncbi:MAG TPA: hypothetical protein VGE07_07525 [Herpetosiphonaceae bacterium]
MTTNDNRAFNRWRGASLVLGAVAGAAACLSAGLPLGVGMLWGMGFANLAWTWLKDADILNRETGPRAALGAVAGVLLSWALAGQLTLFLAFVGTMAGGVAAIAAPRSLLNGALTGAALDLALSGLIFGVGAARLGTLAATILLIAATGLALIGTDWLLSKRRLNPLPGALSASWLLAIPISILLGQKLGAPPDHIFANGRESFWMLLGMSAGGGALVNGWMGRVQSRQPIDPPPVAADPPEPIDPPTGLLPRWARICLIIAIWLAFAIKIIVMSIKP